MRAPCTGPLDQGEGHPPAPPPSARVIGAPRQILRGRLRLVDAPRTSRIPIRLALERDGVREERAATLVVNKFGLHRLDPAE